MVQAEVPGARGRQAGETRRLHAQQAAGRGRVGAETRQRQDARALSEAFPLPPHRSCNRFGGGSVSVVEFKEGIKGEGFKLSPKQCSHGVEVLASLDTVERAYRLDQPRGEQDETTLKATLQRIATNVVKNDQAHGEFSRFIRKAAGYEYPLQTRVVAALLPYCFEVIEERFKEQQKLLNEQSLVKGQLAAVG